MNRQEIAALIDHTNLRPDATSAEIRQLCREAREHQLKSVCVNPVFVPLAADQLRDSGVLVCTVIGFPLGATYPEIKVLETRQARQKGATEFDMVLNVGALKAGEDKYVEQEIAAVVKAAGPYLVKVIIEACLLSEEEKIRACRLAVAGGAYFVKTSTGFAKSGAALSDVILMRRTVGPDIGVKAAGGIRNLATLEEMVQAGANRIGTSAALTILAELPFN